MQDLYKVSTIHRTPDTTGGVQLNVCIRSSGILTFYVSWRSNQKSFTNYAEARQLYIRTCYEHKVSADLTIRLTNIYGVKKASKACQEDQDSVIWFHFDNASVDIEKKYGDDLCLGHCETIPDIRVALFKYLETY